MAKVLIPVDGSAPSLRAIDSVLKEIEEGRQIDIHVLNVQPQVISGHARAYLSKEMVDEYYREEADKAMKAAKEKLEKAGARYTEERMIGAPGECIARYVKSHGIEMIVMGTRGLGTVQGMLLGSVASKVLHLVDVPVLLVK
ncbi:MAG: universal stress protein [Burkholderiaceae bacterium]|nr:universal stress protein [Burkholderiaceae bacterium]